MTDAPKTYEGDDLLTWLENRTRFDHFAHTVEDGGNVLTSVHATCENSKAAAERIRKAEARAERLREGYADAVSALDYVRFHYGELHGVGFDRVRDAYDAIEADTQEADHD